MLERVKSRHLQGDEVTIASTCLYFKSKYGFVRGGEVGGGEPNRYDKLRAKLGELSTSPETASFELSLKQRLLIGRAAKYVIGHSYAVLMDYIHESVGKGNLFQQSRDELENDAALDAHNLISGARNLVGAPIDDPAADELFARIENSRLSGG